MDLAVPANHRVKLNECEKKDKYFDLARVMKKLWNTRVTFIPIIIGALGTVTKRLVKGLEDLEIRGQMEIIQTTTLLTTARILRRVMETCCHSNFSERPSAKTDVKKLKEYRFFFTTQTGKRHGSYEIDCSKVGPQKTPVHTRPPTKY